MATQKSTQAASAASANDSAQSIAPAVSHGCASLSATIIDLGARIGALDQRSRKLMGVMLQWLADDPDDAPEIAEKATALQKVQCPMVRNAELHQALTRPNAPAFTALKGIQS